MSSVTDPDSDLSHDVPMSLGDHLAELRVRLIIPIAVLVAVTIGAFFFYQYILDWILGPYYQSVAMMDVETLKKLRIDPAEPGAIFRIRNLTEGPVVSVKLAFYLALVVAFPVLIYQMWKFIVPALTRRERRAGFLFVPAAIIFFYFGLAFGYTIGMPYLFMWLLQYNLGLSETVGAGTIFDFKDYFTFFFAMVLCFGFIMDVPWLVLILVKVGIVDSKQIASKRRYIIMVCAVLGALLSPPDPFSMMALALPMYLLFEVGLFASRFLEQGAPKREQA